MSAAKWRIFGAPTLPRLVNYRACGFKEKPHAEHRWRFCHNTNGNPRVSREDFGAHEYRRNRKTKQILSEGDTIKAAVTDCIKRCAHQLDVGFHLYSPDGSYQSFRVARLAEKATRKQVSAALPTAKPAKSNGPG